MDKKITFEELCKNKEFLQKVIMQKSEDDVRNLFAEKGVEVTQQDLNDIKETIYLILGKKQKLSPREKNEVAGGMPPAARAHFYSAMTEAMLYFLRSDLEKTYDPGGLLSQARFENKVQGFDTGFSPSLTHAVESAQNGIITWWKGGK
ncbi:MAG: hypothetical protein RUMPE_00110 [Eubacteriales bacterium SKADARSKE-1]|nr:hypothetical protein [Eubacteriales bacterium SKADARSKE-1]